MHAYATHKVDSFSFIFRNSPLCSCGLTFTVVTVEETGPRSFKIYNLSVIWQDWRNMFSNFVEIVKRNQTTSAVGNKCFKKISDADLKQNIRAHVDKNH